MKRVVIKVSSSAVLAEHSLKREALANLFSEVGLLMTRGIECVLVLSGAVGRGKMHRGLTHKQAQASYGQLKLLSEVHDAACEKGVDTALLLISREDIVNRERYHSLQETVYEMLQANVVLIVNENDATSPSDTHEFTDNDRLATILAITINADALVILTKTNGVYTDDPFTSPDAKHIPEIDVIDNQVLSTGAETKTVHGRGGMMSKLQAARLATAAGIHTYIAAAHEPNVLRRLFIDGERVGTYCRPRANCETEFSRRSRWLMSAHHSGACVQIDAGAALAVRSRKSLLAVGVRSIQGNFRVGESIEVVDEDGGTLALGLASIDSDTLRLALHQDETPFNVEVIHADNCILLTALCVISPSSAPAP
ncbi:MAG: glutamate 5-kinase [Candidatus Kerfeldbacteria bacterium]|nr:glutamate 5-kinase [Candidatus Kerfeldbacteria bacterium]